MVQALGAKLLDARASHWSGRGELENSRVST
jgi:hypothetical protein